MDELRDFCTRMLGAGEAADQAAQIARESGGTDRVQALAAAVAACRRTDASGRAHARGAEPQANGDLGLVEAVAGELSRATAQLPERQREALALRERIGLSHAQIATALGVERAAVAPLLARSRLRLRSELRGSAAPPVDCSERDRALRTMALRQDGEEVSGADEDWLLDHLGNCAGCSQAHAAMLEASVCYRAWRLGDPQGQSSPGGTAAQ
jgi:Sigma-70, region 4